MSHQNNINNTEQDIDKPVYKVLKTRHDSSGGLVPSESWNGQLDNTGEHLPQRAFTWLAKVGFVNGDSRVYKGSVTLLR